MTASLSTPIYEKYSWCPWHRLIVLSYYWYRLVATTCIIIEATIEKMTNGGLFRTTHHRIPPHQIKSLRAVHELLYQFTHHLLSLSLSSITLFSTSQKHLNGL